VFIFRLVECRCDCVGVPAYKIIDGYVAIVAEKLVFFDVSAEGISTNMAWIDVPARTTNVAVEEMTGQTSPSPTAFAIICAHRSDKLKHLNN